VWVGLALIRRDCNLPASTCACWCWIRLWSAAALLGHARAARTSKSLKFLARSCMRIKLAAVMDPTVEVRDMLRGSYQKEYESSRIVKIFFTTESITKVSAKHNSAGSQTTHSSFHTRIFIHVLFHEFFTSILPSLSIYLDILDLKSVFSGLLISSIQNVLDP